MKKIILVIMCIQLCVPAWGFYDFCESPQDYNTFPAAYDIKTEYWKDIPNYNGKDEKIQYKNIKNNNPIFPFVKKKQKQQSTEKE